MGTTPLHLKDCRYSSIDLETTGLDPKVDEIVAFASVPLVGRRILTGDAFYTLIKPKNYNIHSMKYHGLCESDLKGAPSFKDVADRILQCLNGVIIGHSVGFDSKILQRYFKEQGVRIDLETLDIVLVELCLGRKRGKMGQDLTFEAMLERYGLIETYRHNALADAFFVAQMFQIQMLEFSRLGIDTWEKLQKAVKSCRYALW